MKAQLLNLQNTPTSQPISFLIVYKNHTVVNGYSIAILFQYFLVMRGFKKTSKNHLKTKKYK